MAPLSIYQPAESLTVKAASSLTIVLMSIDLIRHADVATWTTQISEKYQFPGLRFGPKHAPRLSAGFTHAGLLHTCFFARLGSFKCLF